MQYLGTGEYLSVKAENQLAKNKNESEIEVTSKKKV